MLRVQAQEAPAAKLARLGRWMSISGVAAGLLLAMTLALSLPWSTHDSTAETTVQASEITFSSTDMGGAALVLLAAAAAGMSAKGVMHSDRDMPQWSEP